MPQHTPGRYERGGSGHPSYGSRGGRPPQQPPRINVPISRIVFAEKIDPKLYSDIAQEAAIAVAGEAGSRNSRNKPSQLRRFYDELVALQEKARDDKSFDQHLPFIQMLKAKVAYAEGRDKVDTEFVSLLNRVVDQSINPATLRQARLFMEAFMAFYKVHGPREG
jgi:CRISPR-associated protein Csm2